MKKFVSVLKSYIGHTGAYFMFSTLVFVLVAEMLKSSTVNLPLIWSALTFGALTALCDLIFVFPYLRSYIAKTVIHGILTIASFAFAFVRVSSLEGVEMRGRTAVFAVLVFSVLYLILATIRCVYHFVTTKKENEKKEYTNLYTPTNVD